MSDLENPLLDYGAFQSELAQGFDENLESASEGLRANPDGTAAGNYMYHYIGEDGLPYRENRTYNKNTGQIEIERTDERVYYWQPSDEHKVTGREASVMQDATDDTFGGNIGAGFYTEAEIRRAWSDGEMAQLENQGVTWDKYWGFVSGVTDLVSDGTLDPNNSLSWMENDAYSSLVDGLGIQTDGYNSRGDVYNFNGFGYTRDYFADKSDAPVELINAVALGAVGAVVGPALAGVIGPALGLGTAAANAAAAAIVSSAKQLALTGDLSLQDALMQAAVAYGGTVLGDAISGSEVVNDAVGAVENSELNEIIQGYIDAGYSQETIDKMYEVLQGGLEAGAEVSDIVDVIGDVINSGVVEVVWDEVTGEDKEGEFDPDAEDNPYDPELIDPPLPEVVPPEDEDTAGGGGGTDAESEADGGADAGAGDPGAPEAPAEPELPVEEPPVVEPPVEEPPVEVPPEMEEDDGRWVYQGDGVWVAKDNGEVIIGPEAGDGVLTDEEMEGAWESGDYTWGGMEGVDPEVPAEEEDDILGPGWTLPDFSDPEVPVEPPVEPVEPPVEEPTQPPTEEPESPEKPSDEPVWDTGGWDLPGSGDTGGDGGDGTGSGGDGTGGQGGDGTGEGSGTGSGGGTPGTGGGTGGGTGTGTGTGTGSGTGPGNGTGSGGDSGMLSGGSHDPEWGELFAYTTLTPYQKEAMRPYVDYIEKARGMLS